MGSEGASTVNTNTVGDRRSLTLWRENLTVWFYWPSDVENDQSGCDHEAVEMVCYILRLIGVQQMVRVVRDATMMTDDNHLGLP